MPLHRFAVNRALAFAQACQRSADRGRLGVLRTFMVLLVLAHAPRVDAQAPRVIPFQGRLLDAQGKAVIDGARVIQFQIYSDPVGGTPLWAGEVHRITVNGGMVNVMLGTKNPLPVDRPDDPSRSFFDSTLYLQITPDSDANGVINVLDAPLLPRQSVVPVLFASEAGNARRLAGFDWSLVFGTNVPPGAGIPIEKLAPRTFAMGTNAVVGGIAMSAPLGYQRFVRADGEVTLENLVVTLQTVGRPVFFSLVATLASPGTPPGQDGTGVEVTGSGGPAISWQLYEGSRVVFRTQQYVNINSGSRLASTWPPSGISGILQLDAGTHVLRLKGLLPDAPYNADADAQIYNVALLAYEL